MISQQEPNSLQIQIFLLQVSSVFCPATLDKCVNTSPVDSLLGVGFVSSSRRSNYWTYQWLDYAATWTALYFRWTLAVVFGWNIQHQEVDQTEVRV